MPRAGRGYPDQVTELRVNVPDDVAARLGAEAAQRGTSVEAVAADLLTRHVPAPATNGAGPRRPGFVGVAQSGRHDLSERVEEILAAELDD